MDKFVSNINKKHLGCIAAAGGIMLFGSLAYYLYKRKSKKPITEMMEETAKDILGTEEKKEEELPGFYKEQFPQEKVVLNIKEAELRSKLVSDCKYVVALQLFPGDYFEGYTRIEFNLKNTSEEDLFLDAELSSMKWILVNGKPISLEGFQRKRIRLPRAAQKQGTNIVEVYFKSEYSHGGEGLHCFVDPSDQNVYLWSQCESFFCHHIFPCFDQPDIKARIRLITFSLKEWEVITNEYHTYYDDLASPDSMAVLAKHKVPIEISVLSQAKLLQLMTLNKGNVVFRVFELTPLMPVYLFAVCAGKYHYVENNQEGYPPMKFYSRNSLRQHLEKYAEEFFFITRKGIDFYLDFYGFKKFHFNKYDQIFVPEFNWGAMENIGCVTFTENYLWKEKPVEISKNAMAITILHELAHMWFGDLVTMKWWNDLWLNEAFATIMSHIVLEKGKGLELYTKSWQIFQKYKAWACNEDQLPTTHCISSNSTNTEEAENAFDGITYAKGSSSVKQLIYLIGYDTFKDGIQRYFKNFAWQNTVLDQFLASLQEAVNADGKEINMAQWGNQWLCTSGLNEIQPLFTIKGEKIDSFVIKQSCCEFGENILRSQKMCIAVYDHDMKETIIEEVTLESKATTAIQKMIGRSVPAAVFLNKNDHAYVKVKLDPTSLTFLKKNIHKIEDEVTKIQMWRVFWDMVRDHQISGAEFVEMTASQVEYETNTDCLNNNLRYSLTAITSFTPPDYRKTLLKEMFGRIHTRLGKEQESNLKQALFKIIPHFSFDGEDNQTLMKWLDKGVTSVSGYPISGIEMGAISKYTMLIPIHRDKDIDLVVKDQLLKKELENDISDEGETASKRCEAAMPILDLKNHLWEWYIDPEVKDSDRIKWASMATFWHWSQMDILESFIDRFFIDITHVFETTSHRFAESYYAYLSPPVHNPIILKKYEELLTTIGPEHITFKKKVEESIVTTKRTLQSQRLSHEYLSAKPKK